MSEYPSKEFEATKSRRPTTTSIDSGTYDFKHEPDLETHCRCPCGNTNFLHCIDPPPECLTHRKANTRMFPEMDVSKGRDSETVKKLMTQHLLVETTKLKDIFTDYGMAVRKHAESIHGKESPLYEILRLRYPEKIATTNQASFNAVYKAVTDGIDFLNVDPLECVLRECSDTPGNERSNELLSIAKDAKKKYDDAFYRYAQLRVFSYVDGLRELLPPIQENTYDKLKIKVENDFAAFTIGRAKKLEEKIRNILGIHKEVCLRLTEVEQGCIEITFEIVGKLDVTVFELDMEKKGALASHNISMLRYAEKGTAGDVYYCCCQLLSTKNKVSGTIIESLYNRETQDGHDSFSYVQPNQETCTDTWNHSPDCPSIQNKRLKCPVDECAYCGIRLQFCTLQFHTMICDKRKRKLHRAKSLLTSSESIQSITSTESGYVSSSHDQDIAEQKNIKKGFPRIEPDTVQSAEVKKQYADSSSSPKSLYPNPKCLKEEKQQPTHNGVHLYIHHGHAVDQEGGTVLNMSPRPKH